ncbi:hypothetical protein OFC08_35560, partial [Escherichia coli]|nr:hypothetical protein [Escherichia coli]
MVVSVAGLFIAAMEPIAGIKKLSDTWPTSTGFPELSVKDNLTCCLPFRSMPSGLESVTVKLFP